jgi:large subunit ribosomal protein L6
MSNIGKIPVQIPDNINIEISSDRIKVRGPKGELEHSLPKEISVVKKGNILSIQRNSDSKRAKELHGLSRSLISNLIEGVNTGFEKRLKMVGVGFKAQIADTKLVLNTGFSHPVEIEPVTGIEFKVEKNTQITVSGIDKELVGRVASKIRAVKKPEPYKGKGIMYEDEKIRRKAGKTLKAGPTGA